MPEITVNKIKEKVESKNLLELPISSWENLLREECDCYALKKQYLCKRFNSIEWEILGEDSAKEILLDNLYTLFKYKYFYTKDGMSDEANKRMTEIVNKITTNLRSFLKEISLEKDDIHNYKQMLPDGCVAFNNGVYDFKNNKWFFKYEVYQLNELSTNLYRYNDNYVIFWYLNYNFEPYPYSINDITLEEQIELYKDLTKDRKNYCFELMYNMAFDENDKFDIKKFKHLCQINAYLLLQSFSQNFVLMIGSGQNGKNSLYDGCLSSKLVPEPAHNDMFSIEEDDFITGSLINRSHNIYLETESRTYRKSQVLKALTGSMYQTIHEKGVTKYPSIINCKYLFAGNSQEGIKFSDNTTGFRRRLNVLELFYHWTSNGSYLKDGEYYNIRFSDSLDELKKDNDNITTFIYLGMFGMKEATKNFSDQFRFTYNNWIDEYVDTDGDLKVQLSNINVNEFFKYVYDRMRSSTDDKLKYALTDESSNSLYNSKTTSSYRNKYGDWLSIYKVLLTEESEEFDNNEKEVKVKNIVKYLNDNEIYVSIRLLKEFLHNTDNPTAFTQKFKQICPNVKNKRYMNAFYIKVGITKGIKDSFVLNK